MQETNKLPFNLYAEAFGQYAMVQPNAFNIGSKDGQMLVQFWENVYQVSHFNDLMATYKSYFDINHSLIYIELPAAIWNTFVTKKIAIDPDNFIIDLYRAWEMIWDKQRDIYDNPQKYDHNKQQSYADFKHLTYEIHKHCWEEVFDIAQIDPVILFPALAVAIKGQYADELVFYKECVSLMTQEFHDQIGDGFVFEQVNLLQIDETREIFFIYTVLDSIGDDHGAVDALFNRPENEVTGLPNTGKVKIQQLLFAYPNFPLRLYALRVNNRDDIVVLFNGGIKSAWTNQESKDIHFKWIEACRFAKRIEEALRDSEIIIDEDNRRMLTAANDVEILL